MRNIRYSYMTNLKFKNGPYFFLNKGGGGHYSVLAYQAGAGDTDTGDDEYRNSDCIVDRMNVYKGGFCKYLSIPTYMSAAISTGKITTYANHHGSS